MAKKISLKHLINKEHDDIVRIPENFCLEYEKDFEHFLGFSDSKVMLYVYAEFVMMCHSKIYKSSKKNMITLRTFSCSFDTLKFHITNLANNHGINFEEYMYQMTLYLSCSIHSVTNSRSDFCSDLYNTLFSDIDNYQYKLRPFLLNNCFIGNVCLYDLLILQQHIQRMPECLNKSLLQKQVEKMISVKCVCLTFDNSGFDRLVGNALKAWTSIRWLRKQEQTLRKSQAVRKFNNSLKAVLQKESQNGKTTQSYQENQIVIYT